MQEDDVVIQEDEAPDTEQEQQEEQETQLDPAVEQEARSMGWVPQEEFRGDLDKWRPADEFVQRGKEFLPIVQSQNRKLRDQLEAKDREFEERVARMERMNQQAMDRQRQQIIDSYENAKERAVESGDTEAYRRLKDDQAKALKDLDDTTTDKDEPKTPRDEPDELAKLTPDQRQSVEEFARNEPWMNDAVLGGYAGREFQRLRERSPYASFDTILAEVKRLTIERFPEDFGAQPQRGQRRGSPVDSGQRTSGARRNGKSARDLPPEAREAGDRFVGQGLYKNIDEYSAFYWSQES